MTVLRTIPMLPCDSIDAVVRQWRVLDFAVTYRQDEPRGYVTLSNDAGAELHYFHDERHDSRTTSATCLLATTEPAALHQRWSVALAETNYRDVTLVGPHRDADGQVVGFSVVDCAGNQLRVVAGVSASSSGSTAALAPPDPSTAVTTIPTPPSAQVAPQHRFSALLYMADLAIRLGQFDDASMHIATAEQIIPGSPELAALRADLAAQS